jgi:hypothetical protein
VTVAADRAELLATQARARAAEHRRRQAKREAAPAPGSRASIVWLREPVMIGPRRLTPVVGYFDPPGPPGWLQEVLDAAA